MRRLTTPLVALCLAGALAACGSDNTSDSTEASEATTSAAESAPPSETASEAEESATPEAEETTSQETATPEDTGSGVAEAEMLPIPADGPPGITEFPVPAGSQLNDLGAFSGQWQFTILTSDPQSVIDFYAATLPELGYTLEEDPITTAGVNVVEWDLGFTGPAFGTLNDAPALGGVDVIVGDEKFTD